MTTGGRSWPWVAAGPVFAVGVLGAALPVLDGGERSPHPLQAVAIVLLLGACLGAGATLLSRRPGHPVSWLVWLPALYLGLEATAEVVERTVGDGSALVWARWAAGAAWAASFPPLAIFLPLLFPTGRPPSPRWRWVLWTGGASVVLLTFGNATAGDLLDDRANPALVGGPLPEVALAVGGVLMVVSFVMAAASSVVRFRRSSGVERQQLRWFVRAAAVVPVAFGVAIALEHGPYSRVGGVLLACALGLLPVAVAVAVLRYRLYDIDRVVSRTVAWAVLSALLAGVYAVVVLTAQALVGGDVPDLVIALATLTAAALVRPLQRRVQRVVDRRFNRSRYDAEVIAGEFGQRLRDDFEPDHVAHQLAAAVGRAVGPSAMSLWHRQR